MDAATRRELDELRRRAYGPHPDIADDPVALARLVVLEEVARPAPPPARGTGPAIEADAAPLTADGGRVDLTETETEAEAPASDSDSRPSPPRRTPRRRALLLAGASAAVLVVVIAAIQIGVQLSHRTTAAPPGPLPVVAGAAYRFTSDPGSRVVARYTIDGFVPTPGQDERSIEVGEQFGWKLSVLNTSDGSSCIVLFHKDAYRNCVSDSVLSTGGMMVALPYAAVPKTDRPFGMRKNQSIGYWLLPDGRIMIILGPTSLLGLE